MARRRNTSSAQGLPYYEPDSPCFTLCIHHGGLIVGEGKNADYIDGDAAIFDNVDSDVFSIPEVHDLLEELGIEVDYDEENMKLWWCIPKMNFRGGARRLSTDKDIVAMLSYIPKHRFLRIYVEKILDAVPLTEVIPDEDPLSGICPGFNLKPQLTYGGKDEGLRSGVADDDEDDDTYIPGRNGSEEDSDFVDSDYEVEEDENLAANFVHVEIKEDTLKGQPAFKDMGIGKAALEPDDVDSEYDSSDELRSVDGSSDDECDTKRKRFPVFNPAVDMENPVFKIGMLFANVSEFREAIKEYSIRNRVRISIYKNDLCRIRAKCKGRSRCPWRIYGRWINSRQCLQVRGLVSEHTCVKENRIKWVTYTYLAKRFMSRFQADPNFSLESFAETCQRELGLYVSRSKLGRARVEARRLLYGEEKGQYAKLWDYAEEIRHQMPGSTVYVIPRCNLFDKLYLSLDPCKRGFLAGCRPVIFLDGCHIKTQLGGQLLTAVGIDPNDCIYPFAMAVVEVEDRASWKWFLSTVKEDLSIDNPSAWTLVSDRQKGLISAVEEQFSGAEHRFCVRHMYQNFQAIFKGEGLKREVWNCARSSFPQELEINLAKIKSKCPEAWEWLSEIDPTQWTRAHFREFPKCDVLLNNISECFNKFILDARGKSMLHMLESIRCQLMKRVFDKASDAVKFRDKYKFCPKIIKKLNKNIDAAVACWAVPSGALLYQVTAQDGMYIVDIQRRTCTCRRWQLTGIPCPHSIPAICRENMSPEDLLHVCYSMGTYSDVYKFPLRPLRDPRFWTKTGLVEILPPEYTKRPGRPKKARRKSAQELEAGTKLTQHGIGKMCTSCGQLGHNKRTCMKRAWPQKQGGVGESQASTEAGYESIRVTQSSQVPGSSAPQCSSQFVATWSTAQDIPIPQRMPPTNSAFINMNAAPPPSVPMTTATKRGRAAAINKGNKKNNRAGRSSRGGGGSAEGD